MYEFVETFDKESQEIMTCGFLKKKRKESLKSTKRNGFIQEHPL